jgi:hypothetical protein
LHKHDKEIEKKYKTILKKKCCLLVYIFPMKKWKNNSGKRGVTKHMYKDANERIA